MSYAINLHREKINKASLHGERSHVTGAFWWVPAQLEVFHLRHGQVGLLKLHLG